MTHFSSTVIFSSSNMARHFLIFLFLFFFIPTGTSPASSSGQFQEGRVSRVVQKMEAVFNKVENYTCEVEVIYYQKGSEEQRYQFSFYYKRDKKIRVDFSHPYPGLSIFYSGKEKEATLRPLRFFPSIKFHFSVDNPLIKTLSGQRIDQTDMGYFIGFLVKNLQRVPQKEDEFREDQDRIHFLLRAMDYIEEKTLELYRISVSKDKWLPVQIERYSQSGQLLELTLIRNYSLNLSLKEDLFIP